LFYRLKVDDKHIVLMGHSPGAPGLAVCPLDFSNKGFWWCEVLRARCGIWDALHGANQQTHTAWLLASPFHLFCIGCDCRREWASLAWRRLSDDIRVPQNIIHN